MTTTRTELSHAAKLSDEAGPSHGAVVMMPIVLAYSAYAYWIFRGKVKPGANYH